MKLGYALGISVAIGLAGCCPKPVVNNYYGSNSPSYCVSYPDANGNLEPVPCTAIIMSTPDSTPTPASVTNMYTCPGETKELDGVTLNLIHDDPPTEGDPECRYGSGENMEYLAIVPAVRIN